MKLTLLVASGFAASLTAAAGAANIYLLSSGDPATDSAAVTALTSRGHTVTVGLEYTAFDGSVSLAGFQTVYLQCNANWTSGLMPTAGQQQLVDWVNLGGRLVTSEWVIYYTNVGGKFETLAPIIPADQTFTYGSLTSAEYAQVTPDPAISAGLPASFIFPLTSYTGTETVTNAKSGATTYYSTSNSLTAGLAGWTVGMGSVYSFTSTCGPDQVADTNFGRLFANAMGPGGVSCYPNCDSSTLAPALNVADFICFLNRFAAADPYANCDSSTNPPVLNVIDFTCFSNRFAAGCS
jgi:hypothetical protein